MQNLPGSTNIILSIPITDSDKVKGTDSAETFDCRQLGVALAGVDGRRDRFAPASACLDPACSNWRPAARHSTHQPHLRGQIYILGPASSGQILNCCATYAGWLIVYLY